MKNPERETYPALTQREIRALYQACPTVPMRRLVWEIYCLHAVVKTAGSVIRCRNMGPAAMPGALDYMLDELADVLRTETYLHENLPSLHDIKERRRHRTSTKKRNKKAYR